MNSIFQTNCSSGLILNVYELSNKKTILSEIRNSLFVKQIHLFLHVEILAIWQLCKLR